MLPGVIISIIRTPYQISSHNSTIASIITNQTPNLRGHQTHIDTRILEYNPKLLPEHIFEHVKVAPWQKCYRYLYDYAIKVGISQCLHQYLRDVLVSSFIATYDTIRRGMHINYRATPNTQEQEQR